ncbi:hypothetical protein COU17_01420 [Candidatus Kaiserbacteria bacterium CG10_big_fil_rev_8_21_14_0_10_49_17]|uniref:Uncharacterized protein n=1 Tax=Candidatus Kaiserbacteria bacterium CG10_big_fil_rev_8_21_14_0_10_49_17 TaxID=1974609 RepID=A0A2M6WEQ7_9BACT|nr:MAG: hypothetical protein COU17_01420 [Candidatus Kaiserbacteria bacterium CG10_big_fil_rev_8_21_14_0_10_49_17]
MDEAQSEIQKEVDALANPNPEPVETPKKSRFLQILNWLIFFFALVLIGLPLLGFAIPAIAGCTGGFSIESSCSVAFLEPVAEYLAGILLILALSGAILVGGLLLVILSLIAFVLEIRVAVRRGGIRGALKSVSFIVLLLSLSGIAFILFY